MADPWDNVPVVREREPLDQTLNVEIDVTPLSDQERLNLRPGQKVRLPDGRSTRISGQPSRSGQGEPVSPNLLVKETPWAEVPVVSEGQMRASERAAKMVEGTGATQATMQGLTLGFSDEIAGGSARLGQMGRNLVRDLRGQPIEVTGAEFGDAVRDATRDEQERFAREQPVASIGLNLVGGGLTGGAGAARAGIANAARVSAGYGFGAGIGTGEGSFAERLPGGVVGAGVGAVGGAAVQGAGQVVAPRLSGIVERITSIANPGGVARAATRRAGPEAGAAVRLNQMITPESYAERARLQGLGLNPSVLDTLDNTGERLVRSAAGPAGPAADLAVRNARSRTVDLKPEIMGVTRGLSPDPRTANQLREGLEETRDTLATQQYREPYAAQVPLTPEAVRALRGPNGAAAIREAIEDELADPNYDAAVVEELQGLLTADLDVLPSVSGRALDRARIALRDTSGGLMRGERPNRTRARGFAQRVEGVDTALDAAPGLTEARGVYRELSGAIDQLDESSAIFSTDPVDFANRVARLTPTQREAAIIGLRQEILDTLGGQRAAGTGSLQNLAESNYARENLATLLGPEEAAQYIGRIEAGVQQAQRANRVSPSTNSQTAGRLMDDETFSAANMVGAVVDAGQALTGNPFAIGRLFDKMRSSVTLSPQERESIVSLGLGSADELERIVQLAEQASRRGGRNREVTAYLTRTRNTLGAQSPVTQQLEKLLSPGLIAAEEDQR